MPSSIHLTVRAFRSNNKLKKLVELVRSAKYLDILQRSDTETANADKDNREMTGKWKEKESNGVDNLIKPSELSTSSSKKYVRDTKEVLETTLMGCRRKLVGNTTDAGTSSAQVSEKASVVDAYRYCTVFLKVHQVISKCSPVNNQAGLRRSNFGRGKVQYQNIIGNLWRKDRTQEKYEDYLNQNNRTYDGDTRYTHRSQSPQQYAGLYENRSFHWYYGQKTKQPFVTHNIPKDTIPRGQELWREEIVYIKCRSNDFHGIETRPPYMYAQSENGHVDPTS